MCRDVRLSDVHVFRGVADVSQAEFGDHHPYQSRLAGILQPGDGDDRCGHGSVASKNACATAKSSGVLALKKGSTAPRFSNSTVTLELIEIQSRTLHDRPVASHLSSSSVSAVGQRPKTGCTRPPEAATRTVRASPAAAASRLTRSSGKRACRSRPSRSISQAGRWRVPIACRQEIRQGVLPRHRLNRR